MQRRNGKWRMLWEPKRQIDICERLCRLLGSTCSCCAICEHVQLDHRACRAAVNLERETYAMLTAYAGALDSDVQKLCTSHSLQILDFANHK
jgi:hypothetical protein